MIIWRKAGGCDYALAHNGALWNDRLLRQQQDLPKTHIQTDSYIAVQLIDRQKALDCSSLKTMAETVRGSFTFTLLNQRNDLYVVKGDNPFCLNYFLKENLYLYASTQAVNVCLLPALFFEGCCLRGEKIKFVKQRNAQRKSCKTQTGIV